MNETVKRPCDAWADQRAEARRLPSSELKQHAMVGEICLCWACWCCAALSILQERGEQ